jgi:anti-sigma factor RsiW
MTINQELTEREQIEALLPWHAAGTLNTRDAERVERALAGDRELARQFELVREEFHETIHLNESLGAPSARAAQKLFAAIEAEGARAPRRRSFDLAGRLASFVSGFAPRTLAYAAVAGALAIVVQGAVLTEWAVKDQAGNGYGLASQSSSEGPAIMVRFASQATASDITSFLAGYKAQLIAGPKPGNFYQIHVSGLKSPDEIAVVIRQMQGDSKIVDFVAARE